MTQTKEQDFFGGAIRGVVPQRWIDGRSVYLFLLNDPPSPDTHTTYT